MAAAVPRLAHGAGPPAGGMAPVPGRERLCARLTCGGSQSPVRSGGRRVRSPGGKIGRPAPLSRPCAPRPWLKEKVSTTGNPRDDDARRPWRQRSRHRDDRGEEAWRGQDFPARPAPPYGGGRSADPRAPGRPAFGSSAPSGSGSGNHGGASRQGERDARGARGGRVWRRPGYEFGSGPGADPRYAARPESPYEPGSTAMPAYPPVW
jgi:hypothetical protein